MIPAIIVVLVTVAVLAACSESSTPVAQPSDPQPETTTPAPSPVQEPVPEPIVSPPTTPAQPIPPTPPAAPSGPIETILFESDFSQPSIGLKLAITQDTPVQVVNPDDGIYGTFDRPGGEGRDCCDPGPNKYYWTKDGVLYVSAETTGFPICTKQSFAMEPGVKLAMRMTMACMKVFGPTMYLGLVMYDGEANWLGVYFDSSDVTPGFVSVRVWGPYSGQITPVLMTVPVETFIDVAIFVKDGVMTTSINNGPESPYPFTPNMDGGKMLHAPHLSIFAGGGLLAVKKMTVSKITA